MASKLEDRLTTRAKPIPITVYFQDGASVHSEIARL
jgi:hypothetical protein